MAVNGTEKGGDSLDMRLGLKLLCRYLHLPIQKECQRLLPVGWERVCSKGNSEGQSK